MNSARLVFLSVCLLHSIPSNVSAADSLRTLDGRHVRLTTDLESDAESRQLVESFDAAVPQWLRFWKLSESELSGFRVEACVMRDPTRFVREGLIPEHLPDFPFGYAMGSQIWVHAQNSEYYTRHLMLHEGVHCLAFAAFGGAGPTWYQEGTAELLATHRGAGGSIETNQIPASREEVPEWGRFKLMAQRRAEGQIPSLTTVMGYQPNLLGDVGDYGWSWAATMLLESYPQYHDSFFDAARNGRTVGPGFNRQLMRGLQEHWPIVHARWRLMCHDLDYGFDWSREQVELSVHDPLWDGSTVRIMVQADQGWQAAGFRLPRNVDVRIKPGGQVIVANTTKPWISEPAGITFQYHRGRPLGQLMVCVLPNEMDLEAKVIPELPVQSLTGESVLHVSEYSWLLFRVNDDVGKLGDNQGHYELVISR